MIEQPTRRKFIGLTLGLIAAPAVVRASSLMPVKAWRGSTVGTVWIDCDVHYADASTLAWIEREFELIASQRNPLAFHISEAAHEILRNG